MHDDRPQTFTTQRVLLISRVGLEQDWSRTGVSLALGLWYQSHHVCFSARDSLVPLQTSTRVLLHGRHFTYCPVLLSSASLLKLPSSPLRLTLRFLPSLLSPRSRSSLDLCYIRPSVLLTIASDSQPLHLTHYGDSTTHQRRPCWP